MGFFRKYAAKDTYINTHSFLNNYGDDHIIAVACDSPSGSSTGFYNRAFIQFPLTTTDLANLTGNYISTLNIFNARNNKFTDENYTLEIYPITQQWSEGSGSDGYSVSAAANAVSATQLVAWSTTGGSYSASPSASILFVSGTENLTANVSSFVEYWRNSPNYGFLIKFPTKVESLTTNYRNYKYFFSRNTDTFFAPYVDFTYATNIIKDDIGNLHLGSNTFFIYDNNVSTSAYSGSASMKFDLSSTAETVLSLTSFGTNIWYTTWSSTSLTYNNIFFIYSNTANNYSTTSTVTGTTTKTSFYKNYINDIQANVRCQTDYRIDETPLFRANVYHYISYHMGNRAVHYNPTKVQLYFVERNTRIVSTQPQEMGYDQFGYNLEVPMSNLQVGYWYIPVLKINDGNTTFFREIPESKFYVRKSDNV